MMPDHSLEPWRILNSGHNAGGISDQHYGCVCEETAMTGFNLARVVACVNALAGLNPKAVQEVHAQLQRLTAAATPYDTCIDQLHEALISARAALALAKPERKGKDAHGAE